MINCPSSPLEQSSPPCACFQITLFPQMRKVPLLSFVGVKNVLYFVCLNFSNSLWPAEIKRMTCFFTAKTPIFDCFNKWFCSCHPFIQIETSHREKTGSETTYQPVRINSTTASSALFHPSLADKKQRNPSSKKI